MVNGARRRVSHLYGFGLIDANALVNLAKGWKNIPVQKTCEVEHSNATITIAAGTTGVLTLKVGKECNVMKYMEHVQAVISIKAQRRGDLEIYMTSAKGTKSRLLSNR